MCAVQIMKKLHRGTDYKERPYFQHIALFFDKRKQVKPSHHIFISTIVGIAKAITQTDCYTLWCLTNSNEYFKSVTAYRIVTSLFCNIVISEALLNKAGICWTNTPVSNTFEEILIYTR